MRPDLASPDFVKGSFNNRSFFQKEKDDYITSDSCFQ